MNLPRRLLNLLYVLVLKEIERSRTNPEGYNADLMKLEAILKKECDKQNFQQPVSPFQFPHWRFTFTFKSLHHWFSLLPFKFIQNEQH